MFYYYCGFGFLVLNLHSRESIFRNLGLIRIGDDSENSQFHITLDKRLQT